MNKLNTKSGQVASSRGRSWAPFAIAALVSLDFVSVLDDRCWPLFFPAASRWQSLGALRLPSLTVATLLCVRWRAWGDVPFLSPRCSTTLSVVVVAVLGVQAVGVLVHPVVLYGSGWTWAYAVRFMVTGCLVEELVYRGLLYRLASQAWGDERPHAASFAIVTTAALFAFGHVQYFGFTWSHPGLLYTVGSTFLGGVVFGVLRAQSGGIVTPVLLHVALDVMAYATHVSANP